MKVKTYFVLFLICYAAIVSCNSNSNASRNYPNGSSELALLMRDMYDETEQIKAQVEKNAKVQSSAMYGNMLTVEATEPDKQASELYKAMSGDFIRRWEILKTEHEGISDTYTSVVQSCMNCHAAMCPGPMVKIKKLYLELKMKMKN